MFYLIMVYGYPWCKLLNSKAIHLLLHVFLSLGFIRLQSSVAFWSKDKFVSLSVLLSQKLCLQSLLLIPMYICQILNGWVENYNLRRQTLFQIIISTSFIMIWFLQVVYMCSKDVQVKFMLGLPVKQAEYPCRTTSSVLWRKMLWSCLFFAKYLWNALHSCSNW